MQPKLSKLFFHQLQKAPTQPCFSSLYQSDKSKNINGNGWYNYLVPIQWFSGSHVCVLCHLRGKHELCIAKLGIGRNNMQLKFCPALINELCLQVTDSCIWYRQAAVETPSSMKHATYLTDYYCYLK